MSQHKATTQYVALALQQCSVAPARLAKGEGAPHWYLVVGNRSWPNHQFILYCQTKKIQKKKERSPRVEKSATDWFGSDFVRLV